MLLALLLVYAVVRLRRWPRRFGPAFDSRLKPGSVPCFPPRARLQWMLLLHLRLCWMVFVHVLSPRDLRVIFPGTMLWGLVGAALLCRAAYACASAAG